MTDHSMISAGIDVSKDHLDIALFPGTQTLSVPYDAAGLARLDDFLDCHGVGRVGFEASGGYERRLLAHLRRSGRPSARLQPAQVRAFARSRLQRAKNDTLDARLIAAFTASLERLGPLPDAESEVLQAELTYIEQIESQIALIKTFAETAPSQTIKSRHLREIARLDARRTILVGRLEAQMRTSEERARRLDLVMSIKGIGLRGALSLVIRLPELGSASREEIAALAGVAPYDDDSGQRRGRRRIAGGRERLREKLFMCAFTAAFRNPDLSVFYKRLRAAGKDHLLAVVAVARKLVILANAIVARGTKWMPENPKIART